jgi:hypothetical protein
MSAEPKNPVLRSKLDRSKMSGWVYRGILATPLLFLVPALAFAQQQQFGQPPNT